MKIVVDAFGGDNAPLEIVEGVKLALDKIKDLEIVLCGKEEILKSMIKGYESRIEIIAADDVIKNEDHPTLAIRQKKESSLVKAYDALKERDDIIGLVSLLWARLTIQLFTIKKIQELHFSIMAQRKGKAMSLQKNVCLFLKKHLSTSSEIKRAVIS